ncbi:CAP domain-containing protein [Mycobacterium sp. NPDC006124]|uniref:RCC1 domain-containing protein n=1 Tax=Mycobacterium sp. NPDC006124 TaxID=3156729 RepID=UPI0033B21729
MTLCENTEDQAVSSSADAAEAAVLCLINEARAAEGVGPLTLNAKLRKAAREHAMAAATIKWWPDSGDSGHIPHVNPVTGKDEQVRIKEAGYCPADPDGVPRNENAYSAWFTGAAAQHGRGTTPAAAVEWWLQSEGHHRTLVDPKYTETGVGVVHGTASTGIPSNADGAIFVQCFGGCSEPEPLVATQLWAWGGNGHGQLGVGGGTAQSSSPVRPAESDGFIMVAASHHSVGLKHDGTVWTWGPRDNKGSVSGGSQVPAQVPDIDQVIAISAGYEHNLAVKSDGSVWAWGDNRYGQLGDGSGMDQEVPVRVQGLSGVKAVSAGGWHSLALRSDGSVWGWGSNGDGQLGRDPASPNDQFDFPIRITSLINGTSAIAAGLYHTVALEETTGQMWVFGMNIAGCLGTGDPDRLFFRDPQKPAETGAFTGRDIVAIAAADFNSYAVDRDGHVWAMGSNSFHQLGPNVDPLSHDALAHQIPNLSRVVDVSAGLGHALALTSGNELWSWGSNSAGQLGQGVAIGPAHGPGRVGVDNVASFSAGYLHSLTIAHRDD